MLQLLLLSVLAIKGSTGAGIPDYQLGSTFTFISHSNVSDCGGALFMEGTFTTPQYPSPYPNRQVCTWTLTAPEGQLIRLVFTNFAVEDGVQCSYDSVKIYNGPTAVTRNPVKTLCGTKPLIEHVGAKVVTVVFTSNDKIQETGFTAFFHSVPDATLPVRHDQGQTTCGGDYQGAFGTVASPNYPDLYPSNSICSYTITVPYGNVQLDFLHLDIEYHHSCQRDYLEIREENSSGKLLRRVCGSAKSSKSISSTTRSLHLRFVSDNSLSGTGFFAAWKIAQPVPSLVADTAAPTLAPTTASPTTQPPATAAPATRAPSAGQGTCVHNGKVYGLVAGTSCKSFAQLADGSHFRYECPDGLAFDLSICVCRFPGDFVCPSGGFNPSLLLAPVVVTTPKVLVEKPPVIPTEENKVTVGCGQCHANGNFYRTMIGSGCMAFTEEAPGIAPRRLICPDGLVFDTNLCVCNWREAVQCSSTCGGQQPPRPTVVVAQTTQAPTGRPPVNNDLFVYHAPPRPVPAAQGTCDNFDNVYTIVKGGRCHLFTQRTSDGTERLHSCPAGLLFDLDVCACRYGSDFTCSDK